MEKSRFIAILIYSLFISAGCTSLLSSLYGFKRIDHFNQKDYESFLETIPKNLTYVSLISTAEQFISTILLGKDTIQQKDFAQPIQILYFRSGILESFHATCYAKGGLFGLNWNTNNRFSEFMPVTAKLFENEYLLKEFQNIFPEITNSEAKEYVIIIFWTNMLRKISKSAIETVTKNLERFGKLDSCAIYLINSDNFFIGASNKSP